MTKGIQKWKTVKKMYKKKHTYLLDSWSKMSTAQTIDLKEYKDDIERIAAYNKDEFVVINQGFQYNSKVVGYIKNGARGKEVVEFDIETFKDVLEAKPETLQDLTIFSI